MRFLVLIAYDESTWPEATAEQRLEFADAHHAFEQAVYAHGTLVSGDALASAARGFTVRHTGPGGSAPRGRSRRRRSRSAGSTSSTCPTSARRRRPPSACPGSTRSRCDRPSRSTATSAVDTAIRVAADGVLSRLASSGGRARGARRGIPAALGPAAGTAGGPVPPPRPRRGRAVRRLRGGGAALGGRWRSHHPAGLAAHGSAQAGRGPAARRSGDRPEGAAAGTRRGAGRGLGEGHGRARRRG